jgi:integrase/recombinase XerD
MDRVPWERFPLAARQSYVRLWLQFQASRGLSTNTVKAYGRALEDFVRFCDNHQITLNEVSREEIAAYVDDMRTRPSPRRGRQIDSKPGPGLANATLQQRLTALRLYYDFLVEEHVRETNPVGRGKYTPGKYFGGQSQRGLVPRYRKLPWIPTDEQWLAILNEALTEPVRNRVMLAFAYDAALRREELCSLETHDLDPAYRLLRIRAETTKNRQERVVPYSPATAELYSAYLNHRREISRERGPLFLSESRRNYGDPVSIWTWSKVINGIARRSGVVRLTTHTFRHLCLTDLARAGWDIHEIALFAGHRSTQSTLTYIHLSGRDLSAKFEQRMAEVHRQRVAMVRDLLG